MSFADQSQRNVEDYFDDITLGLTLKDRPNLSFSDELFADLSNYLDLVERERYTSEEIGDFSIGSPTSQNTGDDGDGYDDAAYGGEQSDTNQSSGSSTNGVTINDDGSITVGDRTIDPGANEPPTHDLDAPGNTPFPVIVDLDDDGIEVNFGSTVYFDHDDDGYKEAMSWAASDDAFLVIDLAEDGTLSGGDGQIDQSRELVLSFWGQDGDTDLQALQSRFDENNDFVLNSADEEVWAHLRVWQDLNQNAVVDDGELRTLDNASVAPGNEWGITQINLTYDGADVQSEADLQTMFEDETNNITVFGNTLHGLASFVRDDGANTDIVAGGVGDVSLAADELGYRIDPTDDGYNLEFEQGPTQRYAELAGQSYQNYNLVQHWKDGAIGDERDNVLYAGGHSLSVTLEGAGGNDSLTGGQLGDLIVGGTGVDTLRGEGGNDVLFFDGTDVVQGGTGNDTGIYFLDDNETTADEDLDLNLVTMGLEAVYAGDGNDTIEANAYHVSMSIYGGGGNDRLLAGQADDLLSGDDGNDILEGRNGADLLFGGAGNDHINSGTGDDVVYAGAGDDNINAAGNDDIVYAGDGADVVWANWGDDVVYGGNGHDTLMGAAGDDTVYGEDGSDVLQGREGDDVISGGSGWDHLYDGYGDDTVTGGEGNDLFVDGEGDDLLIGDAGDDEFRLATYSGNNVVIGGTGNDTLVLSGTAAQWNWEYVRETYEVQTGTQPTGDGPEPVFETRARGDGQYLFWSGDTFVQVMDIETVEFSGEGRALYWSHRDNQTQEQFALDYIASYPDLISAIGSDWQSGAAHWLSYGQGDGRAVTFNPLLYLASNPDLYGVYGFNLVAVTQHYIDYGHAAGRSPGDFDAVQYLQNYQDLRDGFGADLSAATRHYIQYGRNSGWRNDDPFWQALSDEEFDVWLDNASQSSSGTITLNHVSSDEDNRESFYWASRLNETDPNAEIFGYYGTANTIDGGHGNDTIMADNTGSGYNLDTPHQSIGSIDVIHGGDGSDEIYSGAGDDSSNGGSGSDVILGETGEDTLIGESGADTLVGGSGNDLCRGQRRRRRSVRRRWRRHASGRRRRGLCAGRLRE